MQVMPELTAASVDDLPILKADALKFLTLMRGQLSTQSVLSTFGSLANLLRADSNVVHSYAAVTVERLLASRVCALSLLTELMFVFGCGVTQYMRGPYLRGNHHAS